MGSRLEKMCIDSGVDYAASIWDLEMLEWIAPYTKFYKIGSGDLPSINFVYFLKHLPF